MTLPRLLRVHLPALGVRPEVQAARQGGVGHAVLVQDLAPSALVDVLLEQDRVVPADAALLVGARVDRAGLGAQELVRELLKLARGVVVLAVLELDEDLLVVTGTTLPPGNLNHPLENLHRLDGLEVRLVLRSISPDTPE